MIWDWIGVYGGSEMFCIVQRAWLDEVAIVLRVLFLEARNGSGEVEKFD